MDLDGKRGVHLSPDVPGLAPVQALQGDSLQSRLDRWASAFLTWSSAGSRSGMTSVVCVRSVSKFGVIRMSSSLRREKKGGDFVIGHLNLSLFVAAFH